MGAVVLIQLGDGRLGALNPCDVELDGAVVLLVRRNKQRLESLPLTLIVLDQEDV